MAFKSIFPPDAFGREYPRPGEGILVSNIPSRHPYGISTNDYYAGKPVLRTAPESLGRVQFSPSTGLTYVAYRLYDDQVSGTIAVIDGTDVYTPLGHHLTAGALELQMDPERGFASPISNPVLPPEPLIRSESELAAAHLDLERWKLGDLGGESPVPGLNLANYLGNMPLKRGVGSAEGKILHLHHRDVTVVPLRLVKRGAMSCVVVGGKSHLPGELVEARYEEIEVAEWLALDPVPDVESWGPLN